MSVPSFMIIFILLTATARMFSKGLPSRTRISANLSTSKVPVILSTFSISAPTFVAATIVSISEMPAFSTKEYISPIAVVP